MPAKDVRFHEPARHKLLAGSNILADAVKVTLGPRDATCARALVRRPDRDQGRRICRQRDRAEGQVREHGVAVVVPSPATRRSWRRTSFTICARPLFSNLSFSSISLATDTPSLVTVGRRTSARAPRCVPLGPRSP